MILGLLGAAAFAVAPPQISLVAVPAHLQLGGAGRQSIRVSNHGRTPLVVDAARAGFALSLRGRPRVVTAPAAGRWLTFTPRRFRVPAGGSASITVTTRVPKGSTPGDHTALLLLTTRPRPHGGLAVRMRLGVVVVLRVRGRIVRRLTPVQLAVRRTRGKRTLVLTLANRGNVTETLTAGRLTVTLWKGSRQLARFRLPPRELLPHARALFDLRYGGRDKGAVVAVVQLRQGTASEPAVRRAYRLRL